MEFYRELTPTERSLIKLAEAATAQLSKCREIHSDLRSIKDLGESAEAVRHLREDMDVAFAKYAAFLEATAIVRSSN